MSKFIVEKLPDIDQRQIKRGLCPWCLERLIDLRLSEGCDGDQCPDCLDTFTGKLTIQD